MHVKHTLTPYLQARKRFTRLGWTNVKVICQDARAFRLHEHEPQAYERKEMISQGQTVRDLDENADAGGAELVTMSYALSMIPEFYPVIDSIDSLMSPNGVVGVVDFYVQNQVDFMGRNYMGGAIDRHCMWISRVFWRTWFEIDRVNLEPARRVRSNIQLQYSLLTIVGLPRIPLRHSPQHQRSQQLLWHRYQAALLYLGRLLERAWRFDAKAR
jgi:betaine lipid synthase